MFTYSRFPRIARVDSRVNAAITTIFLMGVHVPVWHIRVYFMYYYAKILRAYSVCFILRLSLVVTSLVFRYCVIERVGQCPMR